MSYDNNMTGVIYQNQNRKTDNHPHMQGQCEIDGVEYWISGWSKTSAKVEGKFLSLSFKRKEEKVQQADQGASEPELNDPLPSVLGGVLDEDVPFMDPYKFMRYCT